MNNLFLDSLRSHQPIFEAILSVCRMRTEPVFVDLCWGETFDVMKAFQDPGIQLDRQERRVVLMRVNDEMRYYVGPNDPGADDDELELGTFASEANALSFAYEYLVKRLPLSEIQVERRIWSKAPTPRIELDKSNGNRR